MKVKVRLSVHLYEGSYYSTRTFPDNTPCPSFPNVIFEITDEVTVDTVPDLENKAKEEARKRGIAYVVNLD